MTSKHSDITPPIPAGRVAFFVDPETNHIRYGMIASHNRYADDATIYEFPRGAPDTYYCRADLPPHDPSRLIVVEWGKEAAALKSIGEEPNEGETAREALERLGYKPAHKETLQDTATREGLEEHGFNTITYFDKLLRIIRLNTLLKFKALYGGQDEFYQYLELVNISYPGDLPLAHNEGKIEKGIPGRIGKEYSERGTWVTYDEVKEAAEALPEGRARNYAMSIVENLAHIEKAMYGFLMTGVGHHNGMAGVVPGGQIRVNSSIVGSRDISEIAIANATIRPEILQTFPDHLCEIANFSRRQIHDPSFQKDE